MEPQQPQNKDQAFDDLQQESRIGRTARMLDEHGKLEPSQRLDIRDRFPRFLEEYGYTQTQAAREIGLSHTTVSEVLRDKYKGKSIDQLLARVHNWMELAARRDNLIRKRKFVETSVAVEILQVAGIVAETCQMGVIFGPARIGKTMTLRAIAGDGRFGDPVLLEIDKFTVRPAPLCRALCRLFELRTDGTMDAVFNRLVERLTGTKRLLMLDEADMLSYDAIEMVRRLHDKTGCPVLFSGKPLIYERMGLRTVGDFSEHLDQLAGRIVIKRDLTERTRGKNPQPLYSLEDIRKLIGSSDLKLHVSKDAEKWLQMQASSLGTGGIGTALICLYLAYKIATARGDEAITRDHLEDVKALTMGHEDATRILEAVQESAGMRRVV